MTRRRVQGLALCLAVPGALMGQSRPTTPGPVVTDRPDRTESTHTVSQGFVQFEAGWSVELAREAGVSVRTHSVPGMLARIGVSRGLEARIAFAGFQVTSPAPLGGEGNGVGDAELGFKCRLADATGWMPDVALIGAVSLPTGSKAITSGRVDPTVLLTLSRPLNERLSVGSNLGASWTTVAGAGGSRTTFMDLTYSLTVGVALLDRVGMFAETFGTLPVNDGAASASLDGGVTWLLRDNLQLDLSGGRGIGGEEGRWFLAAGAAFRFPR